MKRLFPKQAIILVSFLLLAGWIVPTEVLSGAPYNLGVVLAISGSGATYCQDGVDAIKLAVEEINAQGGFLGNHPIKLFIRDTQAKPDLAVRETRDLIVGSQVQCVLGTYSSACAVAIKPVCQENKVLRIAAISNSENITKVNFSPYTYSVVPNSYMQAKAVVLGVAIMAKRYRWKNYMTLASDYEWGRSTQANFVRLLKKVAPQIELVEEYWPPLGTADFKPYISEIMAIKPNFVFGCLPGKDNSAWTQQAKASDFFKNISYPGSLISVSELIHRAKTLPRGIVGLCRAPFFAHMDVPMMAEFVKRFRSKYNRYPSDWAVMEYDAVYALKQGIEKARSTDNDKVKDAMKGMTIDTTRGRLFFRKIDNQLSCASYLGKVADNPKYSFPVYRALIVIKGPESWRPESEIRAAREASSRK